MISLELTIKNIPKIESKIMIGYSNLSNLLSRIKFFDEFSTNRLDISIKILKKFEYASLVKLSKKILISSFELFKIIAIVTNIISELRLKTKLKLFFIKTPIMRIEKVDKAKNISGSKIFILFNILIYSTCLNCTLIIIN